MEEIKSILFASNLSSKMETVFKHAVETAVYRKTNIIILHVMGENPRSKKKMRTVFGKQLYEELKSERRKGARDILVGKNVDALKIQQAITDFFQEKSNNVSGDTHSLISKVLVAEGRSIANEIVATAVEEDCGLIVMGCKQQGLLTEAMGDSVVRKVLKRSSVPVLVVP